MSKILMVVDNLNENHHKVIEFTILGKEEWQYHKTFKKINSTNCIDWYLHLLGTCSLHTGVQKTWKLQESLSKGLKPYWTVIPILKLC